VAAIPQATLTHPRRPFLAIGKWLAEPRCEEAKRAARCTNRGCNEVKKEQCAETTLYAHPYAHSLSVLTTRGRSIRVTDTFDSTVSDPR